MAIPWDIIIIQTVNGIVTGMILALVASGLTLIFGHHGRGQFRARRAVHAGRLHRRRRAGDIGQLLVALVVSTLTVALIGAALQVTTLRRCSAATPSRPSSPPSASRWCCRTMRCGTSAGATQDQEPITGQFELFYLV